MNRLYRADCKTIIDDLVSDGIRADLIYLDPPFNSNRTYSILFKQNGATAQPEVVPRYVGLHGQYAPTRYGFSR